MRTIEVLIDYFRGWLPNEPYTLHAKERATYKSSLSAYAIGYSVGVGACELFIVSSYALGWGTIEGSLSQPLSFLSEMLIVLPGTFLGLAIGAKLSRKLKEKWIC